MTTKVKVYRYSGNTEYAEVLSLLNADGDEVPVGALQFATTVNSNGVADTISHVTPTAGLPVQQQTGATWTVDGSGVTQPVSGTVTAELSATDNAVLDAIAASLAIIDNTQIPVNTVMPGTINVDLVGGIYDDGDGTLAVRSLAMDGDGHPQIDVLSSALPSGAATESKQDTLIGHVDGVESALGDAVTALQVIDDWDETNRAKVNPVVGQAGVAAGAGAAGVNTQRVILASDDPAVAKLTTIDADTGNIATAAAAIQAAVETIDNIVSGSEAQVDIVASLPAGTNAIGKLSANSGVDIGDVDVTSLPGELRGPGSPTIDSYASAAISASANTANQQLVAAPGANKQIWVYGFVGIADTGAGSVSLQDEDDAALSGVMPVAQNGGFAISPNGNFAMPWLKAPTNKALEIDTVTCGFKGVISYAIVSV